MIDLGFVALVLALVLCVYGSVAGVLGAQRRMPELAASSRNAVYGVAGLVLVASIVLWHALLTDNFHVAYVTNHSERSLYPSFKFAALWGGQSGSLLFWSLILSAYSVIAVVAFRSKGLYRAFMPYVQTVLLVTSGFFLALMIFGTNPFDRYWQLPDGALVTAMFAPAGAMAAIPADGNGLNPLLQNWWMLAHPIALYLGYIGFTIPFAFAVAALASRQLGNTWVRTVRRWTLIPWLFLSVGILMGSHWAYTELGWGGYWAWDPVENASLLPWLTATAFLHSILIQERRGMLKVWNMVLIMLTYELVIVGTFITRSGIIESVHTFALSNLGPLFLVYIAVSLIGFLVLLFDRMPLLRSDHELDSAVSREAGFLGNNLLFVGIAFATLWGTLFPVLSELVTGSKITVSEPYFNKVNGPIFLVLLTLMGIGPLLSWRRTSWQALRQSFAWPLSIAVVTGLALPLLGIPNAVAIVGFSTCAFVFTAIVQEFIRGALARQRITGENHMIALGSIMRRNGRRYGGYIVHMGVVLMAVGIIGIEFYQSETQATVAVGESLHIRGYELTYRGLAEVPAATHMKIVARVDVSRDGRALGSVFPERNLFFKNPDMPRSEVGIRSTLTEDVYVWMSGWEQGGQLATFKVFHNPLISWLWIGGIVLMLGTFICTWPAPGPVAVREGAPDRRQPQVV